MPKRHAGAKCLLSLGFARISSHATTSSESNAKGGSAVGVGEVGSAVDTGAIGCDGVGIANVTGGGDGERVAGGSDTTVGRAGSGNALHALSRQRQSDRENGRKKKDFIDMLS